MNVDEICGWARLKHVKSTVHFMPGEGLVTQGTGVPTDDLGFILLTWFNLNPRMDK